MDPYPTCCRCFGGASVPEDTSPHYTLATEGVALSKGEGPVILYSFEGCMRVNQSTCMDSNNTLFRCECVTIQWHLNQVGFKTLIPNCSI